MNTSAQAPTSASTRRVRWKTIDTAMVRFSTTSLLNLLEATLLAPTCSRLHDHLLLLWTRAARSPRRTGARASASDLPGLLEAALLAAPGRGVLTEGEPNEARARVTFDGLLVHPGELDHPLLVLRSLKLTARAVDGQLLDAMGFGLADVIELALRYTDRRVREGLPTWQDESAPLEPGTIACHVDQASVDVVTSADHDCLDEIANACAHPDRARKALTWMIAEIVDLKLKYSPTRQLLGPVLAVRAHGRRILVPASEALDAVAAAAKSLLAKVETAHARQRLQDLTVLRVAQVFNLPGVPRSDAICRISAPHLRLEIAIVSALAAGDLSSVLEEARQVLLVETPPDCGRLVVYAGPRVLGREVVTDTLMMHIEEIAEILADAGGDRAILALFVLEMTQHPGADAIAHGDVLDAWDAWRRTGALLLPAEAASGVAVIPRRGRDLSWDRAAAWAPIDQVLQGADLPPSLEWSAAKFVDVPDSIPGLHADLHHYGETAIAVAASTVPPLAIVVHPGPSDEALLGLTDLIGLADGLRTTICAHPDIADHVTLPDGTPFTVEIFQMESGSQDLPDGSTTPEPGDRGVRIVASADPASATICIIADTQLITTFAGDGRAGHNALGVALHHFVAAIRHGRGAGEGTAAESFALAWNQSQSVLTVTAFESVAPSPAPEYLIPDGVYVQARALRLAAEAVRKSAVPVGVWTGADAFQRGGPAEQVLHALEDLLAEEIRSFSPALVSELARHLNSAWCQRTRGHQELLINLSAPWAENWREEAHQRTTASAMATSALHMLLQETLITAPVGDRTPDLVAMADLVTLAQLVLDAGITAVAGARGLHGLVLQIHASGLFAVDGPPERDLDTATHLGLDQTIWAAARYAHWLTQVLGQVEPRTDLATVEPTLPPPGRTPQAFTATHFSPGTALADAEQALHDAWDCGFDALAAVLGTAVDWPTDPDGCAVTTVENLVREAAAWSTLPEDNLRAAIAHLTLDAEAATDSREHRYTEVERRARPVTHPFISQRPGELLLLPWLIHAAQQLYDTAFEDGRLPHPALPPRVRDALSRHRQAVEQQLEKDITDVARRLGLPHKANVQETDARRGGFPATGGEIDLLIADPATSRLWVVEAKHPHPGHAPHAVVQHIKRFTQAKAGYLDKVGRKVEAIAANPAEAAAVCGAPPDLPWRVQPLIVTRLIDPAAFIADPRVPFTICDYLADLLTDPDDPAPGWWTPPARVSQ